MSLENDRSGRRFRSLPAATALLAAWILILSTATAARSPGDEPSAVSHDGLELVPHSEVAVVYVKPGADFSGYRRVMLLEAHVAFRKNWARELRSQSLHRISHRDIERIKRAMAELFREVFVEELDDKGGYEVVDSPDSDVLLLRPAIIDLDVTAPDLDNPGRSYNFASSAGAATLFLELYDSVSGEILARILDRKSAGNGGDIVRWRNRVTNRTDARRVLAGWAGLLRERLDEIRKEEE